MGVEMFNDDAVVATATEEKVAADKEKKAEKKAKVQEMLGSLQESVKENPEFMKQAYAMSESLAVVNSLGFSGVSNIVNGTKKADGKYEKLATSGIVGYVIKNVGSAPIAYKTKVFTKNADGIYEGQEVERTLAPGAEAPVTRAYLFLLAVRPEFSFKLKNGTIVVRDCKNQADIPGASHFKLAEGEGHINDDSFKIGIDKDGIVSKAYVETFGDLNNPKPKKERARKDAALPIQVAAADYYNKMFN